MGNLASRSTRKTASGENTNHNTSIDSPDSPKHSMPMASRKPPTLAIFIHAGAGFHNTLNEPLHLDACSRAAWMGMTLLRNGAEATEAVVQAIKVLEDLEITNAGFGSNLNEDGMVECDATLVDHKGRSGGCGAVSYIRNPICLAELILNQSMVRLSLGRLPPNLLVGDGAAKFAKHHGMALVGNELMASPDALARFRRWQDDIRRAGPSNYVEVLKVTRGVKPSSSTGKKKSTSPAAGEPNAKRMRRESSVTPVSERRDEVTDTVGCIAVDQHGNIAAGSSSGGIGMKHRGRMGPAALVGIGTAVAPVLLDDPRGLCTASVMSGTGEHFATTMAAQRAAERMYYGTRQGPGGIDLVEEDDDAVLKSFVINDFLNHPGVTGMQTGSTAAIGTITVKKDREGIYFYFAHNTDSFALSSMFSTDKKPMCVMSRLNRPGKHQVATGGRAARL